MTNMSKFIVKAKRGYILLEKSPSKVFDWPQVVNNDPKVEVDDGHEDDDDQAENIEDHHFRAQCQNCRDTTVADRYDDEDPHQEEKDNLNHSEELRSIMPNIMGSVP